MRRFRNHILYFFLFFTPLLIGFIFFLKNGASLQLPNSSIYDSTIFLVIVFWLLVVIPSISAFYLRLLIYKLKPNIKVTNTDKHITRNEIITAIVSPLLTYIIFYFFLSTNYQFNKFNKSVYLEPVDNNVFDIEDKFLNPNDNNTSDITPKEEVLEPNLNNEQPHCPISSGDELVSEDGMFYLFRDLGIYKICDQSNAGNTRNIEYYESRVQNGLTLVITVYGDKMFIADLKNKTLKYIDMLDFPEKERLYNNDNSPDLWLFGPKEEDLDNFSPLGDKLIIGASNCHDCQTLIKNYVLNLKTLKITELGYANGNVKWLDNNTVSWEEFSYDMEQKPLGTRTKFIE